MTRNLLAYCGLGLVLWLTTASGRPARGADTLAGDALLAEYFRLETRKLADATFSEIQTLADWESRRGAYRQQLAEMLGLDPWPEKTPLRPQITGTLEHDEFTVEKLHFQSRPGLYVTGNLYLPRGLTGPAPTVLYVCGHARVREGEISLGNKTAYQHHGAWFARNGYVCLTIDTLQLGEIEGLHHGTYREGMWWWHARGYTPAGVEAWNCIRALDYLETRPEVDPARFGVTGRSGGGAYSWWLTALDDRIQAAVPVAGITSLQNHVVDDCIEGHCDCMFMLNTYRWDFPMVAALIAPRPLLISNTDKDRIFPLDGVYDVYVKTRKIYDLYGAGDRLGLHICEGPHEDTQQLRVHAFQWMNRWLTGSDPVIDKPAVKLLEPRDLRVFHELPTDQLNTRIHETFVPEAPAPEVPETRGAWQRQRRQHVRMLGERVFRGWPRGADVLPLDVRELQSEEAHGRRLTAYAFNSQIPFRLSLYVESDAQLSPGQITRMDVTVLDEAGWEAFVAESATQYPGLLSPDSSAAARPREETTAQPTGTDQPPQSTARAWLVPRGIGPTAWTSDERERVHIRRRFALLGQTLDGMRTWDVLRGLEAVRTVAGRQDVVVTARGEGEAADWLLWGAAFDTHGVPISVSRPSSAVFLNGSRVLHLPELVALVLTRGPLSITLSEAEAAFPRAIAELLGVPDGHFETVAAPAGQ
jgi:dienelactone hydrolase